MSPRRRPFSPAITLIALLATGCSIPMYGSEDNGRRMPEPRRSEGQGPATQEAACRAEAERVLRFRDRGQIMREDDADARVGLSTATPTVRAETDRLGARFERDRLIQECMRGAGAAAPQSAPQNLAPPQGSPPPRS
jgi:hypothetical protein